MRPFLGQVRLTRSVSLGQPGPPPFGPHNEREHRAAWLFTWPRYQGVKILVDELPEPYKSRSLEKMNETDLVTKAENAWVTKPLGFGEEPLSAERSAAMFDFQEAMEETTAFVFGQVVEMSGNLKAAREGEPPPPEGCPPLQLAGLGVGGCVLGIVLGKAVL